MKGPSIRRGGVEAGALVIELALYRGISFFLFFSVYLIFQGYINLCSFLEPEQSETQYSLTFG